MRVHFPSTEDEGHRSHFRYIQGLARLVFPTIQKSVKISQIVQTTHPPVRKNQNIQVTQMVTKNQQRKEIKRELRWI